VALSGNDAVEGGVYRIDTGRIDTGRIDTGRIDTGRIDTGRIDTGRIDTGRIDTGRIDQAGPGQPVIGPNMGRKQLPANWIWKTGRHCGG